MQSDPMAGPSASRAIGKRWAERGEVGQGLDVAWSDYAEVYDLILQHNPAYRDILRRFERALDWWSIETDGPIVDVGAGTGNFSLRWARRFPDRQVLHLDMDAGMNRRAEEKRAKQGIDNLEIRNESIEAACLPAGSVAALSCVHALYTFADPGDALDRMSDWLDDGGLMFLCDLGRELDLRDWSSYFARHLVRQLGVVGAARTFWRGREILRQNRVIRRLQQAGTYWTHTPEAFRRSIERAGFSIEHQSLCFRGYSDLIIARKSA